MYQLPAPSTLEDVFSMNPGAFNQAQQMLQGGFQQADANLQKSQLANLFDQQNNPQLLQQQALQNQTMGAQLPGVQANSDMLGMKRDQQRELYPDALKAARNKFLAEATEHDITQLEQYAQKLAYTAKTKEEREQAEQLLGMHRDLVRDRKKQEAQQVRQLALSKQAHEQNMERDRQAIGAGKYPQNQKQGSGDPKQLLTDPKISYEKRAGTAQALAYYAETEEEREFYNNMATDFNQKAHELTTARTAQGQAGKPDIEKLAKIPVIQKPPVNPFAPVTPRGATPNKVINLEQDIAEGIEFSSPAVEAQVRAKLGAPKDNTDLMRAVKAAGQTYEPNKYDYRVTPDGRVQRKLKE